MSAPDLRDDGGMTLIEIVIATAVVGIILPTIMGAFLLGFLESDATRDRLADSNAAQLTSSYLLADIQSSQEVWISKSECQPSEYAGGSVLLQIDLVDPATGITSVVSYIDRLGDDGRQHELHRVECTSAGSTGIPLVLNLATSDGLKVSCDGDETCSDPTPENVKVTVRAESVSKQAGSSYAAYDIEFDVNRRTSS